MTPRTGYNVLVLSEYNPRRHGENRLRLVRHVETWEEAQSVKKEMIEILGQSNAEDLLIYPMRRRETKSAESEDVKKKDEFNPFHDELGRFTDADGSSTISFGDRDSPMTRALKADIQARSVLVDSIMSSPLTKTGKTLPTEDQQKYAGQIEAIKQALMVMSPADLKLLDQRGLVLDTDFNAKGTISIPSLTGARASAFYVQATSSEYALNILNSSFGTAYKPGQVVMSAGYDDEKTYNFAIHELHHAKWDSIKLEEFGTASASDRDFARTSFSHEYDYVMSEPELQEQFKAAFGSYGSKDIGDLFGRETDSNRQEAFTTMAEAYYAKPNFGLDVDADRKPLTGQTNEHYFNTVKNAFPDLATLVTRWEELSALTLGQEI